MPSVGRGVTKQSEFQAMMPKMPRCVAQPLDIHTLSDPNFPTPSLACWLRLKHCGVLCWYVALIPLNLTPCVHTLLKKGNTGNKCVVIAQWSVSLESVSTVESQTVVLNRTVFHAFLTIFPLVLHVTIISLSIGVYGQLVTDGMASLQQDSGDGATWPPSLWS